MEPLTDAQRALVEQHLNLVKMIVWDRFRQMPASIEMDDLQQAGRLGLVLAAQRYDATSNASFETYARFRIHGAISDYLRGLDTVSKEQRQKIKAGEESPVCEMCLDELSETRELCSSSETPEEACMALDFSEQLRSLVEGLDGREQIIVQQYYYQERKMRDIGVSIGCSEPRVSQIHKAVLIKLASQAAFVERIAAFRFALTSGVMRRLGTVTLALLSAVAIASAQSGPVPLGSVGCKGNAVQIVVSVPLVAGAITVPVPVCAELGSGLTLNTNVTPPRIEVSITPAVQPRAVIQKFNIPAALPAATTSVSFTLTYTPTASAPILSSFRSSRATGDVVDFLPPGGGASPKTLNVTVPSYRPFTVDDVLTVVYWTTDAP